MLLLAVVSAKMEVMFASVPEAVLKMEVVFVFYLVMAVLLVPSAYRQRMLEQLEGADA
jgi:hypothetical protein